jgi:hypothetical protein
LTSGVLFITFVPVLSNLMILATRSGTNDGLVQMTSALQPHALAHLSEAVHGQLWRCIDSRLERGDTLVRPQDFQRALEADYAGITGQRVSRAVRRSLANSVVTIKPVASGTVCRRWSPEFCPPGFSVGLHKA